MRDDRPDLDRARQLLTEARAHLTIGDIPLARATPADLARLLDDSAQSREDDQRPRLLGNVKSRHP